MDDYIRTLRDKPISTHALREEGDLRSDNADGPPLVFLPTPSARRATVLNNYAVGFGAISTHALREEGDPREV